MKLAELFDNLEIKKTNVAMDTEISGICYDSRKVTPGSLFVCIEGYKTDGHAYIDQALEKGAVACVVRRVDEGEKRPFIQVEHTRLALAFLGDAFYGHPSAGMKMIGVTGTNGKTTTTYLLKSIIEEAGGKVGLIGTNQNMIGDAVLPAEHTTPESLELSELLAQMRDAGVDHVVMEVSSHSLYLNRVAACHFDVGIFTNITQDHLDFHGTMEEYLKAKAKLFSLATVGVLNRDDPGTEYILEHSTSKNFTFSIDHNDADVMAKNIRITAKGVDFEVLNKENIWRCELGIPGRFSVYNALGAITCALILGVDPALITAALKKTKGVKGRVEVVDTGDNDYTVIIDYAHTPDGLYNVLSTVRAIAPGRVVCLFGCGGDRDKTKRPKMGHMAASLADFCIVTSDNPRTEDPEAIIADILPGMKDSKAEYVVIPSRKEAIFYALDNAKKHDIIVLAGKGHETYQILKTETIHFDEREVVEEYYQSRGNKWNK